MIATVTTAAVLTDLLYRVEQHRRALVSEVLARHHLNLTQWMALGVLRKRGVCTMTELAQASAIDRTSLTRTVDGLIVRGCVVRSALPGDRRAVIVQVSTDGEALASQVGAEVEAVERRLLAVLDEDRQASLALDLAKLLSPSPAQQSDEVSRRSRSA
ncbi:MAG TPA: MarR family transcriptional regulator [Caulobacter sp.]|nr:MarR family transcriptional regulator [Caulobacter sp.]